jgi:hypothetical protein
MTDWIESDHDLISLFEHDLRANASRLSRGKTGFRFPGSCSKGEKRPADLIGAAVRMLRSPPGRLEEGAGAPQTTGKTRRRSRWGAKR